MIDENTWLRRLSPGPCWLPLAARCLREQQGAESPDTDLLPFAPRMEDDLDTALRSRALDCLEQGRTGELAALLAGLAQDGEGAPAWTLPLENLLADPGPALCVLAKAEGTWAGLLAGCLETH